MAESNLTSVYTSDSAFRPQTHRQAERPSLAYIATRMVDDIASLKKQIHAMQIELKLVQATRADIKESLKGLMPNLVDDLGRVLGDWNYLDGFQVNEEEGPEENCETQDQKAVTKKKEAWEKITYEEVIAAREFEDTGVKHASIFTG